MPKKKRREEPTRDLSKPGRKISFSVPRNNGGELLVEGAWLYEGAELDFAADMGRVAATLLREGKLWWDGKEFQKGPKPAPVPPAPPGKLEAALHAFNASRNTEKLELLMRSIGSTVEQVLEHSKYVSADGTLNGDDGDGIEALLGSALLSCQAHMRGVLRHLDAIRPLVRRRKAVQGTLLAENHRRDLLKLPTTRQIGSYSLTHLIWALADYHKQRVQWPARWSDAKGDTKRSISIISAAGVTQTTAQKLQAAVRAIGVSRYANLDLLGVICDHWGNVLSDDVRHVLGA